ncbi:MAG: phosphodiester glycosidase family protein [Clostridia bacterium]|nr:phosphodiester glycosidase family protein [Clostridia bacterium]
MSVNIKDRTKKSDPENVETVKIRRRNKTKRSKKERRLRASVTVLTVFMVLFLSLSALYAFIVYTEFPFVKYWRTIWIETAMTTKSHLWLAEWFFPEDIVLEVTGARNPTDNVVGGMDNLHVLDGSAGYEDMPEPEKVPVADDILGQKKLTVGGKDYAGNTVLINDIDEGIVVSEIVGPSYKGQIMLIDDPSRVYVGMTQYPGVTGMRILDMMEHYGAVAGVNASGFQDPNENGNGGEVVGMSLSEGQYWGTYAWHYGSIVLTTENKLVVGNILNWDKYGNIRDGMQFSPVLIADGVKQVSGSSGYGIQPRTAVGQREDGVIVFLVIDGRDVTHSIGCTVDDMAEELLKYGVINASSCDGGATTALAYDGKVLNKNCSLHPDLGRILPNAFLVKPKSETKD